eukprot:2035259-Alexandrium_andersonii.AAC.1
MVCRDHGSKLIPIRRMHTGIDMLGKCIREGRDDGLRRINSRRASCLDSRVTRNNLACHGLKLT